MLIVFRSLPVAAYVTRVRQTITACSRRNRRVSIEGDHRPLSSLGMELGVVVKALDNMAPATLAESWDNVGLLVEPTSPHTVNRLLLTNDLTEDVLDEAVHQKVDFILSYHPPLFNAVKRLTGASWKERCIVRCLERRMAVYSPHTSWDALNGGVNDWLAGAFRTKTATFVQPITSSPQAVYNVELDLSTWRPGSSNITIVLDQVKEVISTSCSDQRDKDDTQSPKSTDCRLLFSCCGSSLDRVVKLLQATPPLLQYLRITNTEKIGAGRLCTFQQALPLSQVVQIIKGHLNLSHLRLALGRGKHMEEPGIVKVAICAGSGSSVLRHVQADLYWTGEMSHHDVLDTVHQGISVALCEHSNTERGFLTQVAPQIRDLLQGKVDVVISKTDRDPLTIV